MNLDHIIWKRFCGVSKWLENSGDMNTEIPAQGPLSCRFDEERSEYLYDKVFGLKWAKKNFNTDCFKCSLRGTSIN